MQKRYLHRARRSSLQSSMGVPSAEQCSVARLETLEARMLMSAVLAAQHQPAPALNTPAETPTATLGANGTLTIVGTSGNDTAAVSLFLNPLNQTLGGVEVSLQINDVNQLFPLSSVTSIAVYMLAGDDNVTIGADSFGTRLPPGFVLGQGGHDTIISDGSAG